MGAVVSLAEAERRVVVTATTQPGATVAATILDWLARRPAIAGWDWIIDVRCAHLQATPMEIDQIATAFNAATSSQAFVIYVSEDPATHERCAQIAPKFRNRCFLVARTLTSAKSLLPRIMQII
ncbi:MAG: hypothetical protein ACT6TH_03190 [Brevundimonas sp.]|uniref:hypothetical protein n=1 Tax=Brevundimonas sp. TaxID=1871086 RepID=UPI0040343D75